VAQLGDRFDDFSNRVAGTDLLVKFAVYGDVNVLVDGGAQYCARLIAVVCRQVGAAARKG
jgi:hypothetical protein